MNAAGIGIRRAGPEDAAVIREMVGELADHQDEGKYVLITVDRWRELLGRDDIIVLIAERSSQAAGAEPVDQAAGTEQADQAARTEPADHAAGAEPVDQAAGYVSALRRPHLWSGTDILALDDLYVRDEFRDGGLGRELMLELARIARPDRLTISWGMRPENTGAQRFYTRLGATLRPKVVAAWDEPSYSGVLDD